MMLFQQTMLNSTIEPIANRPSFTTTERISSKSGGATAHGRTVNFSSSTKIESSSQHQEKNQLQQQQQQQQQAGVKRSHHSQPHNRRRHSTNSVPIPNNAMLRKTPSEEQLSVDEQMADERDFIFYARLVSGISERRASSGTDRRFNNRYNEETDRCLTHIIQTRHHNIQEQEQSQGQQHQQQQRVGVSGGVLIEDKADKQGGLGYYLGEDNACFNTYSSASSSNSSSSSSSSSSSTYQQDFDNQDQHEHEYEQHNINDVDLYEGDNECIFDLEL